jgi:hypothetical protein
LACEGYFAATAWIASPIEMAIGTGGNGMYTAKEKIFPGPLMGFGRGVLHGLRGDLAEPFLDAEHL